MKYLPVFVLLLFLGQLLSRANDKGGFSINDYTTYAAQTDAKEEAFTVLRNKCNACHGTKKRTEIFSMDNMNSLAIEINKQVFVEGKMPKGRKVKLTEEETRRLEVWLDATQIEIID